MFLCFSISGSVFNIFSDVVVILLLVSSNSSLKFFIKFIPEVFGFLDFFGTLEPISCSSSTSTSVEDLGQQPLENLELEQQEIAGEIKVIPLGL